MYQPYPQNTQLPETRRPLAPASVLNAVKVMYVGAATSIGGIVIDVLTVSATKRAIERRSRHLTASQINSSQHVLVIPVWLVGLTAVVFLWRRGSTEFFKATSA